MANNGDDSAPLKDKTKHRIRRGINKYMRDYDGTVEMNGEKCKVLEVHMDKGDGKMELLKRRGQRTQACRHTAGRELYQVIWCDPCQSVAIIDHRDGSIRIVLGVKRCPCVDAWREVLRRPVPRARVN